MADTHQALESWYEIWFGPEDNRRHFKRVDEESMSDEIEQLLDGEASAAQVEGREVNDLNIEVTKVSVSRKLVKVN